MKKYLAIFKATILNEIQYISNILLSFVGFFITMFIFLNLWKYLYSDPSSLINGYSYKETLWYVLFTETLWFGTRNKTITNQISDDIKTGSIAYLSNKPYNYLFYIMFKHAGEIVIKLFMFILFSCIFGLVFIGSINIPISTIPLVIIAIILGILINTLICITISSFSFYIEDSTPFHWLYSKLILVIGTIFPIEFFPSVLQPIIKFSPVFVVVSGPIKLLINFNMNLFFDIILFQVFYIGLVSLILFIIYKKGVLKLNVNGG